MCSTAASCVSGRWICCFFQTATHQGCAGLWVRERRGFCREMEASDSHARLGRAVRVFSGREFSVVVGGGAGGASEEEDCVSAFPLRSAAAR